MSRRPPRSTRTDTLFPSTTLFRSHSPADAGFAIGRVEEHVRVGGVREWPVPERGDVLVEVAADPGDLGLADPGVGAERLHEIVDLAGGDAVDVRLHHDRKTGLVDPAAAVQTRRGLGRASGRERGW